MTSKAIFLGAKEVDLLDSQSGVVNRYMRLYFSPIDSTDHQTVANFPSIYDEFFPYEKDKQYAFQALKIGDEVTISFSLNQGKDERGFVQRRCAMVSEAF